MNLLPIFSWFSENWIGELIRRSSWAFPAIEAVHIVALTVLFGAILFVDLQVLGLVRRNTSVSKLATELDPWTFSSLLIILVTGFLLFASEALKLYNSTPFKLKIVVLAVAIAHHFTIQRWITSADADTAQPIWSKLNAVVSIGLWLSVGLAGRAIGFF